MLSKKRISEMNLRSPSDLAERLGVNTHLPQQDIMTRFHEGENPVEVKKRAGTSTLHAAALSAFWRLLEIPGSMCVVIAAEDLHANLWIDYMQAITMSVDPGIANLCRWPRWNVLKVGSQAGYEMRLLRYRPEITETVLQTPVTWVILGASCAEPRFCAAREAVESTIGHDGHRHIIVW